MADNKWNVPKGPWPFDKAVRHNYNEGHRVAPDNENIWIDPPMNGSPVASRKITKEHSPFCGYWPSGGGGGGGGALLIFDTNIEFTELLGEKETYAMDGDSTGFVCYPWIDITDRVWWDEGTTTIRPTLGNHGGTYNVATGVWSMEAWAAAYLSQEGDGPTGSFAAPCWWTDLRPRKIRITFNVTSGEYQFQVATYNDNILMSYHTDLEDYTQYGDDSSTATAIKSGEVVNLIWPPTGGGFYPNDMVNFNMYAEFAWTISKVEIYVPCEERPQVTRDWMAAHAPESSMHPNYGQGNLR